MFSKGPHTISQGGVRPALPKKVLSVNLLSCEHYRRIASRAAAEVASNHDTVLAMDEGTLKFARLTWAVTSTTSDFYALQGDRSKAIEWLQLAIGRGDERVSYFRRNPRLASLRIDPRFQSLLKSVESRRN